MSWLLSQRPEQRHAYAFQQVERHWASDIEGLGKIWLIATNERNVAQGITRDRVLFLLAYPRELHASEIRLLQRTDVDLQQGRITVHRFKGSLSAVYPLQPDVIKLLRSYLRSRTDSSPYLFITNRGVPIDRRTLWCAIGVYGKRAGLPPEKQKFHRLKHSMATYLLDAEADLAFVKHWLGHKNIQNTTIYAQLTTGRQDAAARKLFVDHRVV
jgi:integrase/recombinase XerD